MSNIYSNSGNIYNNVEKKRPISASAVVRIVIWSVVFCLLTGVFAVAMWGNSGFGFGFHGLFGYNYDDSDFHVGNGTTDRLITDLTIGWVSGSVTVIPAEGDEIVISEDFDGKRDHRLRWKVDDGELIVKYAKPALFGNVKDAKDLTVAIPSAMLEGMDEIHISTVSSSQDVRVSARELEIDTVSGSSTVKGDYRSVEVDAVSGNVSFDGTFEHGTFDGVSARVNIRLREQADSLDMDTVSGHLTLILPNSITGFRVNTDTVSGHTDIRDFDLDRGSNDEWGDGSMEIRMDGISGKLAIEKETED